MLIRNKPQTVKKRPKPRLSLEQLEERCLLSATPLDDIGNTFVDATEISLNATQSASVLAEVNYIGDVDVFKLTATSTGAFTVQQFATPGSSLNSFLTIYDDSGKTLTLNDNSGDTLNSQVAFHVDAGQTYFIEATASPSQGLISSPLKYALTVTPFVDDVGNNADEATVLPLNPGASRSGAIDVAGDVDVFQITSVTTTGLFVSLSRSGQSSLDAALTITDSEGNVIARNDDLEDSLNSQIAFLAQANETYFVQASASPFAIEETSSGAYDLSIVPFADEAGNTLEEAIPITNSAAGTVGAEGDSDLYEFVATSTTSLAIDVKADTGSSLNPMLTVLDSEGNVTGSNDDFASGQDSRFVTNVTQGQTYYFRVAGRSNSTGAYQITVNEFADDFGNVTANAGSVTLDQSGNGSVIGNLEVGGDVDVIEFTATLTGDLRIRQEVQTGSSFEGQLQILDSFGKQLAKSSGNDGSGRTEVVISVVAGQTFFAKVDALKGGFGSYELGFSPLIDDFGNDFRSAESLTLDATGGATQSGNFGSADLDYFQFVAPLTGSLSVSLAAANGSVVDTIVEVFDSSQSTLTINDDVAGSRNSQVAFEVMQGQTYFIEASTIFARPGEYQLTIASYTDDALNDFTDASVITIDGLGDGTQAGTIEVIGDQDLYQFVSTVTGNLRIELAASGTSDLDGLLTIFDSQGNQIDQDDESGAGSDSRVNLTVTQGETYFIRASATESFFDLDEAAETGAYQLTLSRVADDFGNDINNATDLTLDAQGGATQSGEIGVPNDLDVFRIVATETGSLVVTQKASSGSTLDSLLTILDSTGTEIASNDDSGFAFDSQVSFNVEQGQTYFIQAGAFSTSTGNYDLTISKSVDDFGNSTADATGITLSLTDTTAQNGIIGVSGDEDFFTFVAGATGGLLIEQKGADGQSVSALFDSKLAFLDSNGAVLAENDDTFGSFDSRIVTEVVQGETYFVRAGAFGDETGAYQLSFTLYNDDVGTRFDDAKLITLDGSGSGSQTGTVEIPGDTDTFRIDPTFSGQLRIQLQNNTVGSIFDGALTVFDQSGFQLISNDDNGDSLDSSIDLVVTAGETYFIQASGSPFIDDDFAVGDYLLSIGQLPVNDDYANELANATDINFAPNNLAVQRGSIEVPGDQDLFRIVPNFTGDLVVRLDSVGLNQASEFLDPNVQILDSSGNLLATNDDFAGSRDSELVLSVTAGETLFVRTGGSLTSLGDYALTLFRAGPGADDFGSTINDAEPVSFDLGTPVTQSGQIEAPFDRDVFTFTAQTTGEVLIDLVPTGGGTLAPTLTAFDGFGAKLGQDGATEKVGASQLLLTVDAGETYYVQAGAFAEAPGSFGSYDLTLSYFQDDVANDVFGATPLTLDTLGNGSATGTIDVIGDVDVFSFIPTTTGALTITQTGQTVGASGPLPSGKISVLDFFITELASSPANGNSTNEITVSVTAGEQYFIQVQGAKRGVGGYSLNVAPTADQVGNDSANAQILNEGADVTTVPGRIETVGDVDVYQFTAGATGDYRVELIVPPGSNLDSQLIVNDAQEFILGINDDGSTQNSVVSFQAVAGETYFFHLEASPFASTLPDQRIGTYQLNVGLVEQLDLSGATSESPEVLTRSIDTPLGRDLYQFIAPTTGALRIHQQASLGSDLDSFLRLSNSSGVILAQSNDSNGTLDSEITINVLAGQEYFIEAGTNPLAVGSAQTGSYDLTLSIGDPIVVAVTPVQQIVLDSDGSGTAGGSILIPVDQQTFSFDATTTGLVTIRSDSLPGTTLNSVMHVFDGTNQLLASTTDAEKGTTQVSFNAQARETYYVRVGASAFAAPNAQTGSFNLTVSADDAGSSIGTAGSLGTNGTQGSLNNNGDIDLFSFVATLTGQASVSFTSASSSRVNATVAALDQSSGSLGSGSRNLSFAVVAGQTYFVQVSGTGTTSGKYNLDLSVSSTTASNTFDTFLQDFTTSSTTTTTVTTTTTSDQSQVAVSLENATLTGLDAFTDDGLSSDEITDISRQIADLLPLGDSTVAIVAVLMVGGEEDELLLDDEEEKDDLWTDLEADLDSTLAGEESGVFDLEKGQKWEILDELFGTLDSALFAPLEDAADGASEFLASLMPPGWADAGADVMADVQEEFNERYGLKQLWRGPTPQVTQAPDINDLLIPDPTPSESAEEAVPKATMLQGEELGSSMGVAAFGVMAAYFANSRNRRRSQADRRRS